MAVRELFKSVKDVKRLKIIAESNSKAAEEVKSLSKGPYSKRDWLPGPKIKFYVVMSIIM